MSIRVMTWVWDEGPTDPVMRLVLLALADIADDSGLAWPSVATIAQRSCMSDRNARRVLRKLEEAGWLVTDISHGRNTTSRYRIIKPDTAMSARTTVSARTTRAIKPDTAMSIKPDTAMSAEPSRTVIEPLVCKAREKLLAVLKPATADAYIAHRKAKRAKLTEHAAGLIAKKLTSCPDPDAAVERSIMNGWTGVFPEQERNDAQPPRPNPRQVAADDRFGRIIDAAARNRAPSR